MNVYILGGNRRGYLENQEFFIRENIADVKDIYYVQGPFFPGIVSNRICSGDRFMPTTLKDIHITNDKIGWISLKNSLIIKIVNHCLKYYCNDWSLFLHGDIIPIFKTDRQYLLKKKAAACAAGPSLQWFLKHPDMLGNDMESIVHSNRVCKWKIVGTQKIKKTTSGLQMFSPGFLHMDDLSKDSNKIYEQKITILDHVRELYMDKGEQGMLEFIKAVFKINIEGYRWHFQDKPERSKEEVERIYNICQSCPEFNRYDKNTGQCGVCQCELRDHITTEKVRAIGIPKNKIQMATTSCPLKNPKWVREV